MSNINLVVVPKWGMEMKEGLLVEWCVAVGNTVAAGDDIADIESSKIANTATTAFGGVVRSLLADVGQTLPCGTPLCVVADASVSDAEIDAYIANLGGAAASTIVESPTQAAEPAVTTVAAAAPAMSAPIAVSASTADDSHINASPVARRLATRYGVNLNDVTATGNHGRVSKADVEAVARAAGKDTSSSVRTFATQADDSAVAATPVARRLARALEINLLDCRATGRNGRVSKADVELVAARKNRSVTVSAATSDGSDADEHVSVKPLSAMRKTIARRLQSSKQDAPHFRVHADIELDSVLALRKVINAQRSDAKISVNDFMIKAVASALMRVPKLNAQFDGSSVSSFDNADISVAVAIEDGVITPIIRAANTKGLVEISNEMRDLATRAKLGRLKAEEFQGGTFSISNLGMYDITAFDAIINPPQVAILAISSATQRPVVRNGELAVATVMTVSLSCDHRVIDGADGAVFVSTLKGLLEQPGTMLA